MQHDVTSNDYYKILGIPRTAGKKQIKAAYRQLALKYHPDRNQGNKDAEEIFKKVSDAYSVLSDNVERSTYDRSGGSRCIRRRRFDADTIFKHFFGNDLPMYDVGTMFGALARCTITSLRQTTQLNGGSGHIVRFAEARGR